MPKGDGVKNESLEARDNRMRGITLSNEDLAKNAISAPSPDKIHQLLNVSGRPPCFDSPEQLAQEIEGYFKSLIAPVYDEGGLQVDYRWVTKPTVGGLAIYLGVSRDTIWRYSKNDNYSDTIKRAKDIIASFAEGMLIEGKNPVGAINTLVNMRIGWVADEKTIKVEPVLPDRGAQSTEEIAAFLDAQALPEPEED